MSNRFRRRPAPARHPLCLSLMLALTTLPAVAQDAEDGDSDAARTLDTIVVTAQKREQQVEEVPISISAYSGDFLDRHGIEDYGDLGSLVPGLEVQMQSTNNPSIAIRGITSDANEATVEPRISLFQDGVSVSRFRGSVTEMFDLQRVEVLRGPQGTLFGRGAQNGAIHLIQAKPSADFSASIRLGLGDDEQRLLSGHVNGTLGEGSLYGRFAFHSEQRDGYIDNLAGGTLQGKDTLAVRGGLRFDISDRARVDVILNHQNDNAPGTVFRSMVLPTRTGSLDLFDGSADHNRGDALTGDRDVTGVTVLGDFFLNESWSLSTITGWRDYDVLDHLDSDGSQVNLVEFDEDASGDQFSHEFRFNYDNGGNFSGFVGISWFDENNRDQFTLNTDERSFFALVTNILASQGVIPPQLAVPLLTNTLNPNVSQNFNYVTPALLCQGLPDPVCQGLLGSLPPGFFLLPSAHSEAFANDSQVRSTEFFADGTWQFADDWSLTFGLRATRESYEYGYQSFVGSNSSGGLGLIPLTGRPGCPNFPVNPVCNNILFPATNGRLSADGSATSWVGRLVLGHRFSDQLNGYASVSRGRRPEMLTVNDLGVTPVDAEIIMSYEVGLKGHSADRSFTYDLTAYYYDYSNFQAQVQNPAPPPFFVVTNAGNAHALGVEAALFKRFNDNVSAWFNYAWNDGRFNAVDDAGNPQLLAGNRFRLNPEHSISAGLDWRIPLRNGDSLSIRPSWSYRSHVYFEDANQPGIEQDGYHLFNLRAAWQFHPQWEVGAYVSNAFDEEYLLDAGNTGLLFGIPTAIPGSPRQWGLTLTGRF